MAKNSDSHYYLPINRFEDIRIKQLIKAYGTNGLAVYDFHIAWIYMRGGCYAACSDECISCIVDYFDIREELVKEIISYCGEVGLFDKDMLPCDNIN